MADSKIDPRTYTTDFIHTSDGREASFLGNPVLDSLVHTVVALGTELWVVKRRAKIVESLLAAKKPVTPETIESYVPTAEQERAWAAERTEMIKATYGIFATAGAAAPITQSN